MSQTTSFCQCHIIDHMRIMVVTTIRDGHPQSRDTDTTKNEMDPGTNTAMDADPLQPTNIVIKNEMDTGTKTAMDADPLQPTNIVIKNEMDPDTNTAVGADPLQPTNIVIKNEGLSQPMGTDTDVNPLRPSGNRTDRTIFLDPNERSIRR
jgi:hypothetical protein